MALNYQLTVKCTPVGIAAVVSAALTSIRCESPALAGDLQLLPVAPLGCFGLFRGKTQSKKHQPSKWMAVSNPDCECVQRGCTTGTNLMETLCGSQRNLRLEKMDRELEIL